MVVKVKSKCDSCRKTMLCDTKSMTDRVVQKQGDPKFYCYKCCFKINKGKSAICPHCCDFAFCDGKFKNEYIKWLDNIKGV